jgi:hypothetical protein
MLEGYRVVSAKDDWIAREGRLRRCAVAGRVLRSSRPRPGGGPLPDHGRHPPPVAHRTRTTMGMIQPGSCVFTSSRRSPGAVGVNSKSAVSPGPVSR